MNKTQMKEYYSAKLNKGICKSLKTERKIGWLSLMDTAMLGGRGAGRGSSSTAVITMSADF